jgi:hypothetical protein
MKRLAVFLFLCAIAWTLQAQPALRIRYYSGGQSSLYWTPVSGASSYTVERTASYPAWSPQITGVTGLSWSQTGLAGNTAYIYRIVPRDGAGNPVGPPSNPAVVTTHSYADNPLDVNALMALQHVLDLRTAVASARAAAGAGTAVWTNSLTTASLVADEDINDLRSSLNAAFSNLGLSLPSYVDPDLSGALIGRVHFQQLRDLTRAYPEMVVVMGFGAMSEYYFSPNGDSVKDTTTFLASVGFAAGTQRVDFRWRVDVRNQSTSVVVRSVVGSGATIAFAWDGKNGAGVVQPEALYGFELIDLDSLPLVIASSSARLDVTPPTATITAPADAHVVSNIRLAGGGSVAVTGSAVDETALQQWTLERTGNAQSTVTLGSGTTNLSSGTLATWQTLPSSGALANGAYTLELTVEDKAGNIAVDTVPVTVGHFSASRSVAQANTALNEVVTYTSIVPFPLTLRIDIWSGSAIVKTLVNEPKAAGTHITTWDALQSFPDGGYKYIATVTDGTNTLTWDKSNSYPSGPATTQFEYPKCWTGSAWMRCDQMPAGFDFDPYGGKPLRIAYCVGSGQPDGALPQGGCTGAGAYVIGKATVEAETNDQYDANSFFDSVLAGRQELLWFGLGNFGNFLGDRPRMTIIRKFTSIPENMTVLYGTTPVITDVAISPAMFSPPSVPAQLIGQTFAVTVTAFSNRGYSATASFRNMESSSVLRTITTALQTSGPITFTWDGRAGDTQATLVAPGLYEVRIVVTDSVGSYAVTRPIVVVRY